MPSAKLRLPTRLKETLEKNGGLYGGVLSSLSELDPWISDNKLPFFPEYTDHGPDHINEVFVTAEALIRDEAWRHVTPEDVTVLVLGILLHDCAMHLSEDGFVALMKQKEWAAPVSPIDKIAWSDLWDDFLREAARFDGKKLNKLFGDTEPAKPPPLDVNAMTRRDRLLIGEFLRRYHPRLAHEIALRGVPGPTTTPLKLQNIERKLADLGGLVARSHGMPLRAATDLLEDDERRQTRGVHVPFLMSVLRIADYLQIHAERAPAKLLQVSSLKSPVSAGEWKKHHAIVDINPYHDDPEALYVKAKPMNGTTYVALKRLFASMQEELDDVWAVLGHVYGRVDLRDLGIVIRRLRSNLDDEKAFAETVDYVPGQAEFQAAGADLLKLLVGPLYGDEPEIGIRELLQNAVDACRELTDYLKQRTGMAALELTPQEADVVIALDKDAEGATWLTVSDRGIGMTAEVIKEYFLKAGASFRDSDAWRRQHADKSGKSRVLRSGRFGVGALASFLLGDRIEVSTRHVSQARGIRFSASIGDETIELSYTNRPVGMTIRVRIREGEQLSRIEYAQVFAHRWDWYGLASPSVLRKVAGVRLAGRRPAPNGGSLLDARWRRIRHPEYDDIQWTYPSWHAGVPEHEQPTLCNGIVIGSYLDHMRDKSSRAVAFSVPRLSVFDSAGHLPLNLQRNDLRAKPSFLEDLYDDVCRDFIAYFLMVASPTVTDEAWDRIAYPGVSQYGDTQWTPFALTPSGWTIFDLWHLRTVAPRRFLVTSHAEGLDRYAAAASDYVALFDSHGREPHNNWIRGMLGRTETTIGPLTPLREGMSRRILISMKSYARLSQPSTIGKPLWDRAVVEKSDGCVTLKIGDCPDASASLKRIQNSFPDGEYHSVAEWYVPDAGITPSEPSRIARIWAEVVQHPIIPFDLTERRRVLAHAYQRLAPYIAAHEELLKQGITKRLISTADT